VPNRDVGIQVLGDVLGTRISYAAAVVNGIPDGSNLVTDTDSNGAKDLAGRVVIRPFQPSQSGPTALSALGFHLGGSTGKQRGALPVFRTTTLQQFFSYAADATADGSRTRVTPGVFYYYKAFGAFSEYARSSQVVARNGIHVPVTNHAWGVTASYFLTGESSGTGIIRPRTDFNPSSGHWGAVQVGTRVSRLTVDRQVFDEGLASSTAASEATSFSVVTSWYPTSYVKYLAMFEVTTFADGYAPRPTEHAIIFRAQVAF
jgi:phosphate-selective porin OprO/OprP